MDILVKSNSKAFITKENSQNSTPLFWDFRKIIQANYSSQRNIICFYSEVKEIWSLALCSCFALTASLHQVHVLTYSLRFHFLSHSSTETALPLSRTIKTLVITMYNGLRFQCHITDLAKLFSAIWGQCHMSQGLHSCLLLSRLCQLNFSHGITDLEVNIRLQWTSFTFMGLLAEPWSSTIKANHAFHFANTAAPS